MANLSKTIKIEPSGTAEDTYIVYRKAVPHRQKAAVLKVTYGRSYRLESILYLSEGEKKYLREQAHQIACIEEKQTLIPML